LNKGKIVSITLLLLMILTTVNIVSGDTEHVKWHWDGVHDWTGEIDGIYTADSVPTIYQSFEVEYIDVDMDYIFIPLWKVGSPTGNLQLSIWTISGDLDKAYPDELLYTSSLVSLSGLETDPTYEYFYFNGIGGTVDLDVGEYILLLTTVQGSFLDNDNCVKVKTDQTDDSTTSTGVYGLYDWGWEYYSDTDLHYGLVIRYDYPNPPYVEVYPPDIYDEHEGANIGSMDAGQSFYISEPAMNISEITVWVADLHSISGNLQAEIYAHTGQFGTTGNITGEVLYTSDQIDIDTLGSGEYTETTFTFDPIITLVGENFYFFVINFIEDGDDLGYLMNDNLGTPIYGNTIGNTTGHGHFDVTPYSSMMYYIVGNSTYGEGSYPVQSELTYTPEDLLLRQGRTYTYVVNYTMNDLPLETEGVVQVRIDGNTISTSLTVDSIKEFDIIFSSTGVHTLTVALYFPPQNYAFNVIEEDYTIIALPSDEDEDEDEDDDGFTWDEDILIFGEEMQH